MALGESMNPMGSIGLVAFMWVISAQGALAAQSVRSSVPVVEIRQTVVLNGGPDGPFGEITDATWTERGEIVVLDRLRGEVSAFAGDGAHLWTAGTIGEGPGDLSLQTTDISALPGGRVLVTDPGNLRAALWSDLGDFIGHFSLKEVESVGVVRMLESMPDGSFLAEAINVRRGEGSSGFKITLWALSEEGHPLREVFTFDDIPSNISRSPNGEIEMRMIPVSSLWVATPDGQVVVGRSDRYEFNEVRGGLAVARVERDVEARAVTKEERDRAISRIPDLPPSVSILDGESHPLAGRILFDSTGELWVSRGTGLIDNLSPTGMGLEDPIQYDLFDWESGKRVAVMTAPKGVAVRALHDRRVVGVLKGPNDEPYLFVGAAGTPPAR
jgi:hypothetical protein